MFSSNLLNNQCYYHQSLDCLSIASNPYSTMPVKKSHNQCQIFLYFLLRYIKLCFRAKIGTISSMPTKEINMSKNGKVQYKQYREDYHKKAGKIIIRRADGTVEEQEPMTRSQVEKVMYAKNKTKD